MKILAWYDRCGFTRQFLCVAKLKAQKLEYIEKNNSP
jgi:hypothetical protein